jgi:molybdenum cofactor biosynthesis enzyme MoaA
MAKAFAREGMPKIRLTAGEPLLRQDLKHLLAMLANVDGITDIASRPTAPPSRQRRRRSRTPGQRA